MAGRLAFPRETSSVFLSPVHDLTRSDQVVERTEATFHQQVLQSFDAGGQL
jgi:hypothetical protein